MGQNYVSGVVEVDGARFRFVCFWALTPSYLGGVGYPKQASELVAALPRDLPLVIAGDFNAFKAPQHMENVDVLRQMGLVSAYHASNRLEHAEVIARPGDHATLYWMWHQDRPYHVDYVFVPESWKVEGLRLPLFGDYPGRGLSDHVPVLADVTV